MAGEPSLPPFPTAERRMLVYLPEHKGVMDLVDDGYRFWLRYHDGPDETIDRAEWIVWAEYKAYNYPGLGATFADTLWMGLRAMGGREFLVTRRGGGDR